MFKLEHIDTESERKEIIRQYRGLLRSTRGQLNRADKKLIRNAFEMAAEAHADMRRKSGEPYILHPLAVARIVSEEIGLGPNAIACALLHDVVEDTELTLDDIKRNFGNNNARIVDGLTKISGVFDLTSSKQAENFRKLLLTLAEDVRVILIKIADRLHNMRTLGSLPRRKQLTIASETDFLYAPLAHRLGLYAVKSEMEDLAMKYTQAEMYKMIAKKLNATKRERTRFINEFIKPVEEMLEEQNLEFKIYGRPKSINSIWTKMKKKDVEFEEVYDLFAIRIITNSTLEREKQDCWHAYSIITDVYKPNTNRLRDWISSPKANGYESLHTTVMGPKGRFVEVQIRSQRMDEIAEKGFAAHWKYKEGGGSDNALDEWMEKIRELLNNPESNALDFISDFKLNLFSEEIYVFTPKGQLRKLPSGATSLDFAFDIHTDIGLKCIGAKVNHRLVPLSHKLQNGDQVEIITSKKQKPSEGWLSFVATGKARSKIKSSLKEEKKIVGADGKAALERKLRNLKFQANTQTFNEITSYFGFQSSLDLFYNIAKKKVNLAELKDAKMSSGKLIFPGREIEKKVEPISIEQTIKETLQKNAELIIFGESSDKIAYKFANCCNPIPGDDVFGFVTINDGIKIHRTNCPNAVQLMSNYGYRVVKTKWTREHEISFLTEIKVSGIDDMGVMQKITNIISGELKLNMRSISIDSKDGIFEGNLMVYVNDTEQLELLMAKLKALDGVLSVSRLESA